MPGWSDVYGLTASEKEDEAGFASSRDRIRQIISDEIKGGVSSERIAVGGFSQGAALALYTGLTSDVKLGGVVALSGWLPLRHKFPAALSAHAANGLRILQVHGTADTVVNYRWGEDSHKQLAKLVVNPTPAFVTIHGMGHHADLVEINNVKEFLTSIFP